MEKQKFIEIEVTAKVSESAPGIDGPYSFGSVTVATTLDALGAINPSELLRVAIGNSVDDAREKGLLPPVKLPEPPGTPA